MYEVKIVYISRAELPEIEETQTQQAPLRWW